MTAGERKRVAWLTEGPVLRTLAGARARINVCSDTELRLLLRHFGCEISELDRRLWTGKSKKEKRREQQGQGTDGRTTIASERRLWCE